MNIVKRDFLFFLFLFFQFNSCTFLYSQDLNTNYGGVLPPNTSTNKENINYTDRTTLTEMYNECRIGLNYVQTSWVVTNRYSQGSLMPANFSVSGIPSTATVIKSFAWWVVSFESGSSASPQISIVRPDSTVFNYTATMAGQSIPKCWGEMGTRVFRADITSAISANGAYVCNISGNSAWEIDGLSIFIIYMDSMSTQHGHLIINDGCLTFNSIPFPVTNVVANFNACLNSNYANAFAITSDQQNNVSPPDHYCVFNGDSALFSNIFWNFDMDTTSIVMGQTSFNIGIIPNPTDCWTWAVSGLFFQTDSCDLCLPQSTQDEFVHSPEDIFSIFPNPAVSHFIVGYESFTSPVTIELLDCFGRKVFERYLNSGIQRSTIDISKFATGLYFVRFKNDKNLITHKLVIQR